MDIRCSAGFVLLALLVGCGDKEGAGDDTGPGGGEGDDSGEVETPTTEVECGDGLDDDADGQIDCADEDCGCVELECGDGQDDDADGLIDCEDEDCLDACVEVCGDNLDNDGDGQVDCDDDECFGDGSCEGYYAMTLKYDQINIAWASGLPYGPKSGYIDPFAAYARSSVRLVAEPRGWEGEPFECYGQVEIYSGFRYRQVGGEYAGSGGDVGYVLSIAPTAEDGSLYLILGDGYGKSSFAPTFCPVQAMPEAYLGFTWSRPDVYRREEAAEPWRAHYLPVEGYWYDSSFEVYGYEGVEVPVRRGQFTAAEALTWTGFYR